MGKLATYLLDAEGRKDYTKSFSCLQKFLYADGAHFRNYTKSAVIHPG
jgi:hypothetical protein